MVIRVDRVTLAHVAKTLLGPRSPTHRTDRARDQALYNFFEDGTPFSKTSPILQIYPDVFDTPDVSDTF